MSQFVLEPGGHTAWVEAGWCDAPDSGCGGAWRLDLRSGHVVRHPFDPAVGGDLAWTADGAWLAYSENGCGVPTCPVLLIKRWPDGEPRGLLSMPPDEGTTATWHAFGQVGWHPDASIVVLQANRFSWNMAEAAEPLLLEQRILLVDTTDGSSTPIGPASADDLSFDVWSPPATS